MIQDLISPVAARAGIRESPKNQLSKTRNAFQRFVHNTKEQVSIKEARILIHLKGNTVTQHNQGLIDRC